MRPVILVLPAVLTLALAACAPTAGSSPNNDDQRALAAECEARGGILVATGQQTGRPRVDNVCRISGGASRLPSGR
jgi:hypothetical protein